MNHICKTCGVGFFKKDSRAYLFCSRKCSGVASRGAKRSSEWKEHMSDAMKAVYKLGKLSHLHRETPEQRARRTRPTPARAAAMALLGSKRKGARVPPPSSPEAAARMRGFAPKRWVVRSEKNVIHTFVNCEQWCKDNVHLFHDRPGSKTPLWKRASVGLSLVVTGRSGSWHGWVAVSVHELAEEHAIDLVGRPGDVPDKDELLRFKFPL